MPILEVERAKSIIVLKRSMRPGFAGVDNDLYYNEKCMMLFGDAKDSLTKLITRDEVPMVAVKVRDGRIAMRVRWRTR